MTAPQNSLDDPRELCRKRHNDRVFVSSGEKRTEPMAQTGLRMRQRRERRACAMDPELAKVLVPALADAQQPGLPTRRCLPGYESEPSGKVPGPRECFAGSDGCDQGRCIQHA